MAAKKNCIILSHRPFKIFTVLTIDLDHAILQHCLYYNVSKLTRAKESLRMLYKRLTITKCLFYLGHCYILLVNIFGHQNQGVKFELNMYV